jgi:GIY-YIG catalytic domain-containing protein
MAKSKKPRVHRGLVKGYLERVSSTVFERYSKVITDLVGGQHGIYSLYKRDKLYYVGLATNLKSRVNRHLKDRHAGKWTHFSLYLVRSEKFLRDLESLAIRIADPKGNRNQGKLAGAPDLLKLLASRLDQQWAEEKKKLLGGSASSKKKAKTSSIKKPTGKAPLKGLLGSKRLRGTYKGKAVLAWVYTSGRIKLKATGALYDTPSGAAKAGTGMGFNGWRFWSFKNSKGEWVQLRELLK